MVISDAAKSDKNMIFFQQLYLLAPGRSQFGCAALKLMSVDFVEINESVLEVFE